ncbi:hypothetical protein MSAN_02534400 [Mycena sanguinolenta]|uniref:Uncharacterized protein n=1 Tax=Mycena sanguinolenta TaxID=230812 RepID=A0A8H6TRZ9_9AGAR|nr:hypothetical protein MSAN_02534400 [Mycena sanguinolenta]
MSSKIRKATQIIKAAIDELPMPTDQDSPRTVSAWLKLFRALWGNGLLLSGQFPSFEEALEDMDVDDEDQESDGPAEDNGDGIDDMDVDGPGAEEEEPPQDKELTEEEKKAEKKAKTQLKITKRAQDIIGAGSADPITPDDLFELFTVPVKTSVELGEDMALARVLRGFSGSRSRRTWLKIVQKYIEKAKLDFGEFCKASNRLGNGNDQRQLLQRDLLITNTEDSRQIKYFLTAIIHKIETIKFTAQWNGLTGAGSKLAKRDYNIELFKEFRKADFKGLSESAAKAKLKELKTDLEEFNASRGKIVTARNRLYSAYSNFGTAVLIDPFFTVENLGVKRSKHYASLLDTLLHLAPTYVDENGNGRLARQEQQNRDALYGLVFSLCEEGEERQTVNDYLDDFFEENPSIVAEQPVSDSP